VLFFNYGIPTGPSLFGSIEIMVVLSINEDCGNAPKKLFIKDFLVACANADIATAMEMLTEQVHVDILGYKSSLGAIAVKSLLMGDAHQSKVSHLVIHHILSHGDRCASNGLLDFEDGGHVAFCSMFAFDSHSKHAKIASITTYLIRLQTNMHTSTKDPSGKATL
jgi:hypothetical protein